MVGGTIFRNSLCLSERWFVTAFQVQTEISSFSDYIFMFTVIYILFTVFSIELFPQPRFRAFVEYRKVRPCLFSCWERGQKPFTVSCMGTVLRLPTIQARKTFEMAVTAERPFSVASATHSIIQVHQFIYRGRQPVAMLSGGSSWQKQTTALLLMGIGCILFL